MEWIIPGTTLAARTEDAVYIQEQFRSMFLAGGMVLSQVSSLTGLEPYTIQNWVKRGFLSKPEKKRYTMRQLCRIININMLKSALSMEQICGLLTYVNGHLDDETDDLIDDSQLYFLFLRLAADLIQRGGQAEDGAVEHILAEYREQVPGAKERVEQVLRIMLTAWAASRLCQKAASMLAKLETPPALAGNPQS